jgi:hypothetical protein
VAECLERRRLLAGFGFDLPGTQYGVGVHPQGVVAADVDGDGDVDLVSANSGSDNVTVLRSIGNGTFAAGVAYAVGSFPQFPQSVTAADLDGDGDVDLVTANAGSNTVTVLRNNGNGTFAAGVAYAVGQESYDLAAADLDGDGDADLVTANTADDNVTLLLNNGNGELGRRQRHSAPEQR